MNVRVAERVAQPSWLNTRSVLGLLLFLGSFVGGQRLLAGSSEPALVWVAARELPAFTPLDRGALQAVEAELAPRQDTLYLSAETVPEEAVLTRPVGEGQLIPIEWLSEGAAGAEGRSITIPVSPEHAVGGDLSPGDRVDVYATFGAGQVRSRTVLLVEQVEILAVVHTDDALMPASGSLLGLTVAAGPDEAVRLANAIRTGVIDVARIDGMGLVPQAADGGWEP
jgi:Flp pilus assembly protein CpaB